MHREAEFNGDVYKDQLEKKLTLVGIWNSGKFKEIKATEFNKDLEPLEIQKIFCYTDVHHSDQQLKDWCQLFATQLRTSL